MADVLDTVPQLHLMFDGVSRDIGLDELDVGVLSTDGQIRAAVAEYLEVPVQKLRDYVVDRHTDTGHVTLRPAAVFGQE